MWRRVTLARCTTLRLIQQTRSRGPPLLKACQLPPVTALPPPIGSVDRFTRVSRNSSPVYLAPRVSLPIAVTRFHPGAIIEEYSKRVVRERTGFVFPRPCRNGRPDRAHAFPVRRRVRAQTASFAGHHRGQRHRTGIAATASYPTPRAWHPRRGNRVDSGRSLYLVYRPDRRDQELHLRNATVRYLDCPRRREYGSGHRGDDRHA